jgi:hypothetical protein
MPPLAPVTKITDADPAGAATRCMSVPSFRLSRGHLGRPGDSRGRASPGRVFLGEPGGRRCRGLLARGTLARPVRAGQEQQGGDKRPGCRDASRDPAPAGQAVQERLGRHGRLTAEAAAQQGVTILGDSENLDRLRQPDWLSGPAAS